MYLKITQNKVKMNILNKIIIIESLLNPKGCN